MDIQKYQPVIEGVLRKLQVSASSREDLTQECYVALLESQDKLESEAEFPLSYAESTCRNRILDIWRKEGRQIPTDSLDEPRVYRKAVKVSSDSLPGVNKEMMREAMKTLTPEEHDVVTRLHLEGYSRMEAAVVIGVHPKTVYNRAKSGAAKIKAYFGDE